MVERASYVGEFFAIAALVMFSVNVITTKMASTKASVNIGFLIGVLVNLVIGSALFGGELLLRDSPLQWNGYGFAIFLLAGVFSTFLGRWFFYDSVVRLGAAKASVFQITSPIFAAVIGWYFLGEILTPSHFIGMGIALIGLLIVVDIPAMLTARWSSNAAARDHPTGLSPAAESGTAGIMKRIAASGAAVGIASSLAYAGGFALRSAGVRSWNEPILGTLLGTASGIVLILIFSPGIKDTFKNIKVANRAGVLLYAAGGVLTILAQICVVASMRHIPASIAALITLCTPALVFPMSYLLLKGHEKITVWTVLGSILTFAGILVVLRASK